MNTQPDRRGRELDTLPAKRGYTIVHDPAVEGAWMQIPEDLLVEVGGDSA
jgi:hypothetical protein